MYNFNCICKLVNLFFFFFKALKEVNENINTCGNSSVG